MAVRGKMKGFKRRKPALPYGKRRTLMKRTSKKGAYGKTATRAWANRRRPFVEKKSREKSAMSNLLTTTPSNSGFYLQPLLDTPITTTDTFHFFSLDPFTRMTQGYKEFEMSGDSIYSQSLQLRTEISFPSGQDVIVKPFRVYLICGWVTAPIAHTNRTTITHSNTTFTDVNSYIVSQIKEHFDDTTDRLNFNQKIRSNIKIDKYSRILPSTKESVFAPQTENVSSYNTAYGAPPKVERRHTWKINRKIHYTKGKELADSNTKVYAGDELIQNWYPNDSWLPFACYYMPDFQDMVNQQGVQQNLSHRHNVLHVYSDS